MRVGLFLARMACQSRAKRPKLSIKDESYFDSYGDISIHEEMLADAQRTRAYKDAIFGCKDAIKGKVVLDVGAGTGILSCFCGQAGAARVYAVEASKIAEQAKKVIAANNLQDRIQVIHGIMEEVVLPEKVDVIVSEWMGYCLMYESMLPSVIYARDTWLKPGGIILPDTATLYMAPICDDEVMVDRVHFWLDMKDEYGVDMSCLIPFARESLAKDVIVKDLCIENVIAHEQVIKVFDLYTVTKSDLSCVKHTFLFRCFGHAGLQGLAVWFDVNFSSLRKFNGHQNVEGDSNHLNLPNKSVTLTTSPFSHSTHWKQAVLYFDKEMQVVQDSEVSGSIELTPNEDNSRFLSINIVTKIDDSDKITKTYVMGYDIPIRR